MISAARSAAFRILEKVEAGGYASDLLMRETARLESRDAGLASEIVFGCLRRQAQLDWFIDKNIARRRLDAPVRIALRMGIYQLVFLDRIPAHAAVGESVELVKVAKKASAAGLVNAILRKTGRTSANEWPSRDIALSMPAWMLTRWDIQFGRNTADLIAKEFLQAPETWVRNPPEHPIGVELEPAAEVRGAWRVVSGDPRSLRIQDIGSQSIVPLLGLEGGMTFLDLCSAPGNKTAQAMESGVVGVACDVHWHRLHNAVPSGCARVVLDASEPLPFRRKFDRVLVDAPCSGTGTLGRNPEIRWRLKPTDISELQAKQIAILRRGLDQLSTSGGVLVYSTCSLEREENEDVVATVLAERPEIRLTRELRRTPGIDPGDGFYAAVLQRADTS